jgi:hypothetical protein
MSSFQTALEALSCVHAELLTAVAQTDVGRIEPLVASRGDLLASLALAFAAATHHEREAWRSEIAALALLDRELTARFSSVRDQLAAELARASTHASAPPPERSSGGLNRQA